MRNTGNSQNNVADNFFIFFFSPFVVIPIYVCHRMERTNPLINICSHSLVECERNVCVSVRWTKRRSRDNVEKKVLIRLYCKWDDFLFTFPILRCQSCFPFFSLDFFPVLSFLIRPIHFRAHELCFIFVDGFMEMTLFDISSANRQHASQQRKHGTHSHFPSLYSVLRYSFFCSTLFCYRKPSVNWILTQY